MAPMGVEEVLRPSGLGITNASSDTNTRMHENSGSTALEDFELPSWMSKTDLGAPLEANWHPLRKERCQSLYSCHLKQIMYPWKTDVELVISVVVVPAWIELIFGNRIAAPTPTPVPAPTAFHAPPPVAKPMSTTPCLSQSLQSSSLRPRKLMGKARPLF
ncbi:hypothetical protein EV702DRAFT_1050766 [Suillus placidus]|uniref:Uncharacterized protein n=1 Tax=Suillus placidus TaxID=48579 RepID=A0A9P6ZIC1_9AGAM|nr:hypothetical protein EV702DRAFT_1050766 [Suillus placidus]